MQHGARKFCIQTTEYSMFRSISSVIIVFGEKMCRQRLLGIDFDSGFPCDFSPLCSFFLHARPSAVKAICVLMRDQSSSRRMFLDVTPVACLFASPGQEHPRSGPRPFQRRNSWHTGTRPCDAATPWGVVTCVVVGMYFSFL